MQLLSQLSLLNPHDLRQRNTLNTSEMLKHQNCRWGRREGQCAAVTRIRRGQNGMNGSGRRNQRKRRVYSELDVLALRINPSMEDYRVATQTLSAESSSMPATSVVSFTYCSPGFLPGTALNSSR